MRNLFITWTDHHNLGIPIIDEQHRGISTLINTLHYFMLENHGASVMMPVLRMLEEYLKVHFATEERLFCRCPYPDAINHVAAHKKICREMNKVHIETQENRNPEQLLHFMKGLWTQHIIEYDRTYAEHLKRFLQTHPE